MDDENGYLVTWAKHYYKGRDSMLRTIVSVEDKGYGFMIHHRTKDHLVICISDLVNLDLGDIAVNPGISKTVVTFNTKSNFSTLQDKWGILSKDRWLSIFFINPLSSGDKKWVIHPYNHSSIADMESMKAGLKSIFESVDEMSPEQIKKVINEQEF